MSKIFKLLSLTLLSTLCLSVEENKHPRLCCHEAFSHSGIVYAKESSESTIFKRYSSPSELCDSPEFNSKTKSFLLSQKVPLPDLGETFEVNINSPNPVINILSRSTEFEFFVGRYQIDYIFKVPVSNCQYKGTTLQLAGKSLTDVECWIPEPEIFIRGEVDDEPTLHLTPNIHCENSSVVSSVELKKKTSCRFYECLEKFQHSKAPFNTKSGHYHSKQRLCEAFADYKDITVVEQQQKETCQKGEELVCMGDFGAISQTEACEYHERGYVTQIKTCENGCSQRECMKQRCLESFSGHYCKHVNVCSEKTGVLYNNAEEFCEANPSGSILDKLQQKIDSPFFGSEINKDQEIKTQKECCQKNEGYMYCDSKDNFNFKHIKSSCETHSLSQSQQEDSYFFRHGDEETCVKFKQCFQTLQSMDRICMKDGKFYENKREYCEKNLENFNSFEIHPCSSKNQDKCHSAFSCRVESAEKRDFHGDFVCTSEYDIISDSDDAAYAVDGFNTEIIQCGNKNCSYAECVQIIQEEERKEHISVLTPNNQYITDADQLLLYKLNFGWRDSELIFCRNDCSGLYGKHSCYSNSLCHIMSKNENIASLGREPIFNECMKEIGNHKQFCSFGNHESEAMFFEQKEEYCMSALLKGRKEHFSRYVKDCPSCQRKEDCEMQACFFQSCSAEQKPVIVFNKHGEEKVFANSCKASCFLKNEFTIRTCQEGDTSQSCKQQYCSSKFHCEKRPKEFVCGSDGVVYDNACVSKCSGVEVKWSCEEKALNDFSEKIDCEQKCHSEFEEFSKKN